MMQSTNTVGAKTFAEILEEEWVDQSEALEEKHFDAAFEAKVAEIDIDSTTAEIDNNGSVQNHLSEHGITSGHKKSNCYSPYVPSNALRIQGMIDFVQFNPSDIFCDMGCGDGRVCFVVAATQCVAQQQEQENLLNDKNDSIRNFRAIGIDVSKDCIDMATHHLISNQHLPNEVRSCIRFYQADLTIHPNQLLKESSQLQSDLLAVTVIYLYTYPTLLIQLIPLLSQLFQSGRLRVVVTLTYHIHQLQQSTATSTGDQNWTYEIASVNKEHDLCKYTNISMLTTAGSAAFIENL